MINQKINSYLSQHESILHELLLNADIPAERIKKAMLYMMFPGGKRFRPLLVYLCGELVGAPQSSLDCIAVAVELMHTYSLIHDDLPAMDNDDLRRGKPSCHKAFDEATAILTGDGMQALAIDMLLQRLPHVVLPAQTINIVQILTEASGPAGMVSGQSLDLSELSKSKINEEQLRFIHSLKTGRLITACINMVLAAGQASSQMETILQEFATHLGLVFQMQDDYLDAYAQPSTLGKSQASDSANHKLTFASHYSQSDLFHLITHYFQHTQATLAPFGDKAHDLLVLIHSIQQVK